MYTGPLRLPERSFTADEIPVFVRGGAGGDRLAVTFSDRMIAVDSVHMQITIVSRALLFTFSITPY